MVKETENAIRLQRIVFLSVVTFVFWFSSFIYVPTFPTYIKSLGATQAILGSILGSYGIMQILLRIPVGVISDFKQIRRPFIIFGMVANVVSCFGFFFTENLILTLIFRMIAGITVSTWVAFTVLYANYFKRDDAPKAMMTIQFIVVFAQLTGMVASGYIVARWGLKLPFLLGGLIGLVGLALSFIVKDPLLNRRKTLHKEELVKVFTRPLLLKVACLSAFAHAVLFITMFGYTPLKALAVGMTEGDLGWLVLAFMVPHAIAPMITNQYLLPIMREWHILICGFLATVVFTLGIPFTHDAIWLYITQILNGFAQGMTLPLLMGMAIQSFDYSQRATAMGFFQSVYAVGILLGPLVAGAVSSKIANEDAVFIVASLFALAALVLSIHWGKCSFQIEQAGERR